MSARKEFVSAEQCEQIWQKFTTLAKKIKKLLPIFKDLFSICKFFNILLQIFNTFWQIFVVVVNAQILDK